MPDPNNNNQNPQQPTFTTQEVGGSPVPPVVPQGDAGGFPPPQAGVDNTFGTTANNQPPPVVAQVSGGGGAPSRGIGRILPAVLGLLFLVGAVTAGILLVQQQQDIREGASTADIFCGGVSGDNLCPNESDYCWIAETNNGCLVNGQPEGSRERFAGTDNFDGQVCYGCKSGNGVTVDNENATVCTSGTQVGGNPAKCPGGGTPPGPNPPPPPPAGPVGCANSCTTNADCGTSTMGIQPICNTTSHMCVNPQCPNNTVFGNRCDCGGNTQTCGNPCGNGYPLCGSGSVCRYLSSSCPSSTVAAPTTYCVPETLPTGWTLGACTNDPGNSYARLNGQQPTLAQLAAACNPVGPTAQCTAVEFYNAQHVLIAAADLPKIKAGDIIYLGIRGASTATGTLDRARFTINGTLQPETTTKLQVGANTLPSNAYQMQYTVPAGTTQFSVKGELHHSSLGWY